MNDASANASTVGPGDSTTTFDYAMPSLGADMDEGSVIEWRVGVGDTVERGQVVARVETEKSDIDIEIWHAGVVEEILVRPHRFVPVGEPLLRLRAVGDEVPSPVGATPSGTADGKVTPTPATADGTREVDLAPAPPVVSSDEAAADRIRATPLARRHAEAIGVDLATFAGSGPGGAIRCRDHPDQPPDRPLVDEVVERPGAAQPVGGVDARLDRAERMRTAIARRMSRSNEEIPQYHLAIDADLAALTAHLAALNDERSISDRILPAAAFMRATALAAAKHPELNGHWIDGRLQGFDSVNVSVAISLRGGGLVTPQIVDGASLDLVETMARLRELTMSARSGVISSDATATTSTITVTNLGERGADVVHGLISPPEVALVGFGRIIDRAVAVDGGVVVRPVVTVSLSADHRATDGATGSRFLNTLVRFLEHPEAL